MQVIEDQFNISLNKPTYIALGTFDGLHIGHMELIKKVVGLAKENKGMSMVNTFKEHPLYIINKEKAPKNIIDNEYKMKILEKHKIDIVNLAQFNEEYMKILPEDFIKKLVFKYNAKGIVVGFNFKFGYKNSGTIELLEKYKKEFGYELHVIQPIKYKDKVVSSTRIREAIKDGEIKKVNDMLGYNFNILGKVIHGNKIGSEKLNCPTINMEIKDNIILPKIGVYYTIVEYRGIFYKGITNVGYSPTVECWKLRVETYILDFNKDIYGENVRIYFISRIRNEIKFSSLQELKDQLEKDKEYVRNNIEKIK